MKKTIVYLSEFAEMGGAENSLIRLIRGTVNKYNVILLSPTGELSKLAVDCGAKHYQVDIPGIKPHRVIKNYREVRAFLLLVKKIDSSNVIFHANTFRTRAYLSLLSPFLKSKLVGHVRDYNKSIFNTALIYPLDKTIVISNFVNSSLYKFGCKNKIELIYNGVEDLARYEGEDFFSKEEWNNRKLKVVLLGRIEEWKNQDKFITCAKKICSYRNDVAFYIVGSPMKEEHNKYYEVIKKQADGINSIYFVDYTEKPFDVIKSSDLIVCPSQNEPFGRVIIESLSCLTPVIGSNNGGVYEILNKVSSNIMFDPNDTDDMEDIILKNLVKNKHIINKGYEVYKNNFSFESNIDKVVSIYESL